jgi:hypothetical protein
MTLDEVDQKGSQGVDLGVAEAPPQLVLHLPAFGQCPLADAFPGRARVQPLLTAVPAPLRALQETQRDMSSTSRVVACSATPRGSASRDTVGPLGGDRTKHETERRPHALATDSGHRIDDSGHRSEEPVGLRLPDALVDGAVPTAADLRCSAGSHQGHRDYRVRAGEPLPPHRRLVAQGLTVSARPASAIVSVANAGFAHAELSRPVPA